MSTRSSIRPTRDVSAQRIGLGFVGRDNASCQGLNISHTAPAASSIQGDELPKPRAANPSRSTERTACDARTAITRSVAVLHPLPRVPVAMAEFVRHHRIHLFRRHTLFDHVLRRSAGARCITRSQCGIGMIPMRPEHPFVEPRQSQLRWTPAHAVGRSPLRHGGDARRQAGCAHRASSITRAYRTSADENARPAFGMRSGKTREGPPARGATRHDEQAVARAATHVGTPGDRWEVVSRRARRPCCLRARGDAASAGRGKADGQHGGSDHVP